MKVLHTADIHLRAAGDERWDALERVVDLAASENVGVMVVSGDMFDRQIDAQKLKVHLRELFQKAAFRTVILPGNHDIRALSDEDYYGEKVTVLSRIDRPVDVGDIRLHGLPFEKTSGLKVMEKLFSVRERLDPDKSNILLYHGELLDVFYSRESFGDEEEIGYMPVKLSFFDRLGIDYVLAGHFHSNFEVQRYDGGYFVYPGSPVSITKKETGLRSVNLFEVGKPPRAVELSTMHYDDIEVRLSPFSGVDALEEIERAISGRHDKARVLLTVKGFVDLASIGKTETDFAWAITALKTPQIESITEHWKDIGFVRGHDLFGRFTEKLEAMPLAAEHRERIRDLALEGMMEAFDAD
jgi:DNA repair exonuclease SbcCD nuclease subunit